MAEYFQDILPPEDDSSISANHPARQSHGETRSIRNISVSSRRGASDMPERHGMESGEPMRPQRERSSRGPWLWVLAGAAVLALSGMTFFLLRPTVVTLTPRVQNVILESLPAFTAYPASANATGTLAYTVRQFDVDESEPVKAQGVQRVDRKASGSITVFNDYSAQPVKLVATTRFATGNGLIFRIPADVIVPGKQNGKPGSVTVTVIADASGDAYNIAPTTFSLPGITTAPMNTKVYATSKAAFAGGFAGDEPATDSAVLEAAKASMRGRIEQKVRTTLASATGTLALPDLAQITYTDLPTTAEQNQDGTVLLHERAHVVAPEFSAEKIALLVADAATSGAQDAQIQLVPAEHFAARVADATPATLGTDPISFMFSGHAQLVWQIDASAVSHALAGRDSAAFESIVKGFAAVEKASARIEPFWSHTFPNNPDTIRVIIDTPAPL